MTPLKVRVSVSSDPAVGLPAMVGYSIAGHIVAFVILILAPRVMPRTPPPPLILAGQIVSLPPPAGTPSAPPADRPAAAQKPAEPNPAKPSPEVQKPAIPPAPSAKEVPPKPPPKKKAADVVPPEPGKERAPKEEPTKEKETAPVIPEGVGLATGGEPGGIPSINSAAFPYDWYRATIVNLIRSRWRRPVTPGLTQPLRCSVSFVISRGGALGDVTLAASSGFSTLDLSAVRAVTDSSPLPQLPYQYTAESIRAELVFELTPD